MGAFWEVLPESGGGLWQLFESGQRVPKHEVEIQTSWGLIQGPKRLGIVGVQFKELSNQSLWNLGGRQVHPVQRAKQGQQIEPGSFQPGAEISRNLDLGSACHGPSMTHCPVEVNPDQMGSPVMRVRPCAACLTGPRCRSTVATGAPADGERRLRSTAFRLGG